MFDRLILDRWMNFRTRIWIPIVASGLISVMVCGTPISYYFFRLEVSGFVSTLTELTNFSRNIKVVVYYFSKFLTIASLCLFLIALFSAVTKSKTLTSRLLALLFGVIILFYLTKPQTGIDGMTLQAKINRLNENGAPKEIIVWRDLRYVRLNSFGGKEFTLKRDPMTRLFRVVKVDSWRGFH